MVIFGQINVAVFDLPWSVIHFISGVTIGAILVGFVRLQPHRKFWSVGVGLLVLWELVEITLRYLDVHAHAVVAPLKQAVAGFAFAPETTLNIIGDLIIGSIGLMLGSWAIRQLQKGFFRT